MTIKELAKMPLDAIRREVGKVRDILHKRAARHRAQGTTPKSIATYEKVGEITTKGKDKRELLKEYARGQRALKGGTVRSVKKKKEQKAAAARERRTEERQRKKLGLQTAKKEKKKPKIQKALETYDINKIRNTKDYDVLKDIYNILRRAARARMREFEKAKTGSPAYRAMKENMPTRRPDTVTGLQVAIADLRKFLMSSTGTVEQWEEAKHNIIRKMKKAGVDNLNHNNFDRIFDIYEKMKEEEPALAALGMKYETINYIADVFDTLPENDYDIEQMLSRLSEYRAKRDAGENELLKTLDGSSDIWGIDIFDN